MGLVASIEREPKLALSEWLKCIKENGFLQAPESRVIQNPFTNKDYLYVPKAGEVNVSDGARPVCAIEPGPEFDENGELLVYAPDAAIREADRKVIVEIASLVDAKVRWL